MERRRVDERGQEGDFARDSSEEEAARSATVADAVAASPGRVAHGPFWLLRTSGLLAERPAGASIVSFVVLAVLMLAVCGQRTFWIAALCRNVGSTMIVFAVIAAARLFDRQAFASIYWAHDYGVSAVSAAGLARSRQWRGVLAACRQGGDRAQLRRGPRPY